MGKPLVLIEALDCTAFPKDLPQSVIGDFMVRHKENVCWFSEQNKFSEEAHLAEFDYAQNGWRAGRFIGEAVVEDVDKLYRISIKPRFGNSVFFRMLEEIHNVKITDSLSSFEKSLSWGSLVQKVMAFIWLGKLAEANLHGLPRVVEKVRHMGTVVRGSLQVRESVNRLYAREQLVSSSREKVMDDTVAQLIFQAYQILKKDLEGLSGRMPQSAFDALNQVRAKVSVKRHISLAEYKGIRFKDVYLSWKGIVEFSWMIIQRQHQQLEQQSARSGFGFFIDMAEIWEQYLRSLLKKRLMGIGWRLIENKLVSYEGTFFARQLIPDIIFEKEEALLVWDAKYKRMDGRYIDVDHADFFQIHTYLQYFSGHKKVLAGGLLYPLSSKLDKSRSDFLLTKNNMATAFHVDGVEFGMSGGMNEAGLISFREEAFLDRVVQEVNKKTGYK